MSQANRNQASSAISREFSARLDKLKATQKVRAVVMLQTGGETKISVGRASSPEREAAIEQVRQAARALLPHIDRILERYDGQRLTEDVNALGSIVVETTAEGIKALAASEYVKTMFEDQSIHRLQHPRS